MNAEIVAGTADDVDALEPLWLAMLEHHRDVTGAEWPVRGPEPSWELCRKDYQSWLGEDGAFLLIARDPDTGGPLGYVLCRLQPSGPTFDLGERRGEVDSLVVSEQARGSGLGSALLRECKEELRRRGVAYWSIGVVEANEDAVRLYERVGFRPWVRELLARVDDE
ncbi:GNAT family N-acetyltransferase [Actinomadura fibrosa]|uniref:GNAT family N-acetyltransferase n=1 Tax=Actinomadura fibrosa TaxID=111802 RepID=A0ABW2XGD9_9ACTN|nr:GNAT family N-acetyltransferase [Actinomadura fibrosa]